MGASYHLNTSLLALLLCENGQMAFSFRRQVPKTPIKLKKLISLQQCVRAILIATNRKQQKSIWG